MRVTAVSVASGMPDRCGHPGLLAVSRQAMPIRRPDEMKKEAPPVPEPDKGLKFDVRV